VSLQQQQKYHRECLGKQGGCLIPLEMIGMTDLCTFWLHLACTDQSARRHGVKSLVYPRRVCTSALGCARPHFELSKAILYQRARHRIRGLQAESVRASTLRHSHTIRV